MMSLAYVQRGVLAGPIAVLLTLGAARAAAQVQTDSILGAWHGTSRCVDNVAFPACNDEEVIYEVRAHATAADSVVLRADKIVNGARESMGELSFGRGTGGTWVSEVRTARYQARWTITVQGGRMSGDLRDLPSNRQVRAVALTRMRP
jgi:hypothetical protein